MRPVGLDSPYMGYIRAEFLESTGTQWIDTEYSGECTAKFRYAVLRASAFADSAGRWGEKEALGNSRGSVWRAADNGYFNLYACFDVGDAYVKGQFYDVTHELCDNNSIVALTVNGVRKGADRYGTYTPVPYRLFDTRGNTPRERLGYCSISSAGQLVRDFLPGLDCTGRPCMFDTVTRKPFYNEITTGSDFVVGMNTTQARNLAILPATGGSLTVSLPLAAVFDDKVQSALNTAADNGWTITVQYRDEFEDESIRNKYASCTNRADVEAVNPDYRNDLTSAGEWVYPMPNMVSIARDPSPWFFRGSPMTEVDIELPKLTEAQYVFRGAGELKKARVSMPLVTNNQRSVFEDCPLEELYVYAPNLTNLQAFIIGAKLEELTEDMIVHGDITDLSYFGGKCPNLWRVALNLDYVTTIDYSFRVSPKLSSFECDLPSLIKGEGAFADAILNKESALRILNTIQAHSSGTHNLGLGIHIDHQNDEEVLAAIANAEAKGWTLTVQWNGTPTSTASTMSMGTLIYAKLGEMERPDGTTERYLDWGHYATDWEERGYEQFRSLKSAYSYFNLETPENT